MSIDIWIVGGNRLLRAGLCSLLGNAPDLNVIGEASDITKPVRVTDPLKPDIVLMDTDKRGDCFVQSIRQLKAHNPTVRILVLGEYEDDCLLHEALTLGVAGYIIKDAESSELLNAIQAVRRDELYIHPAMMRTLLREQRPKRNSVKRATRLLTRRETEVLRLIANGYTNRQAADKLFVSIRTIESHRAKLMEKLNASSRAELVLYAYNNGLMERERSIRDTNMELFA